jgi:putative chitinase
MLSTALLAQLYPSASQQSIDAFAAQAPSLLASFEISKTQNRLHFFLAQMGHESSGLKIREEDLNYSAARMLVVWPSRFKKLSDTNGLAGNPQALANNVYGGRMGNAKPNDGWTYRGRGYIQITGRDGYQKVGAIADLPLETQPDLALDPEHALRVACAFWTWKKLNPKCDAGDFTGVTKGINGGTTGLQDRFNWLAKVQGLVPWPLSATDAASAPMSLSIARLKAIQIKLAGLGYYAGSIDGIFGAKSKAALKAYQADNGLPANGQFTAATLQHLGV